MDLFLSYNSTDHSLVENIARGLCGAGLEPFLDRWNLAPGVRWRSKLEETLVSCRAVAVFLGPGEMGLGNKERWTLRSTFKVEIGIFQSYRYYFLAASLR
jgi:hypothetical protein